MGLCSGRRTQGGGRNVDCPLPESRVAERERGRERGRPRLPKKANPLDPQGSRCPPPRAERLPASIPLLSFGTVVEQDSGSAAVLSSSTRGSCVDDTPTTSDARCLLAAAAGDDDDGVSAGWIGVTAAAVGAAVGDCRHCPRRCPQEEDGRHEGQEGQEGLGQRGERVACRDEATVMTCLRV